MEALITINKTRLLFTLLSLMVVARLTTSGKARQCTCSARQVHQRDQPVSEALRLRTRTALSELMERASERVPRAWRRVSQNTRSSLRNSTIRCAAQRDQVILGSANDADTDAVLGAQLGVRTFIGSVGPVENVRMMVSGSATKCRAEHSMLILPHHFTDESWSSRLLHVTRFCPATRVHPERCRSWILWLLWYHQPGNVANQGTSERASNVRPYHLLILFRFPGRQEDS